jgi:hypothetical protein
MTPNKKPEWFQLADADNSASIRKISKGLPIMALVAAAAIIGVGAIYGQPQGQNLASASETLASAVVESTQISTQPESSPVLISDAPAGTTSVVTPIEPKTQAGVANPLAKKPMGGDDDDDEDEDDEDADEDEGDDD